MVGGFRHKGLEELYLTGKTSRIGTDRVGNCVRILQLLAVAGQPEDVNIAGFRFHGLHSNPKRWSLRVTGNYRIAFGWSGETAVDIDLEDYH
jgi:proteic killer suppression protein